MLDSDLAIFLLLALIVAASLWLCDRYAWAQKISPLVWILSAAALVSNLGLIPTKSPLYDSVSSFCVPFAVSLVLFEVRLGEVRRLGRPMIVAFLIATVASVLGVAGASLLLASGLETSIGAEHWKIAGPYAGTYVGGSMNFFALWKGLQIGQPSLFAAANAVDSLTILPLMMVWVMAPKWLSSFFPPIQDWSGSAESSDTDQDQDQDQTATPLIPTDLAILVALAILVSVLSEWLTTHFIAPSFPDIPSILVLTTLALGLGQLKWVQRRKGAWDLGFLSFYMFFAALGAMIDPVVAIRMAPILFAYVGIVFVVHMLVLFGMGRLMGIDLGALTIASTAVKGGPTLVPSVAQAHGWKLLTVPGMLLGLLGYAVGNYVGIATASLVRGALGL